MFINIIRYTTLYIYTIYRAGRRTYIRITYIHIIYIRAGSPPNAASSTWSSRCWRAANSRALAESDACGWSFKDEIEEEAAEEEEAEEELEDKEEEAASATAALLLLLHPPSGSAAPGRGGIGGAGCAGLTNKSGCDLGEKSKRVGVGTPA
jgi:hypothetical protein